MDIATATTTPRQQPFWVYPFKPVRVDIGIYDRIDCSRYIQEWKYDGFRALLIVDSRGPKLWTRQKNPIAMPNNLRAQVEGLGLPVGTVLDGEIWNMDKRGQWAHDKTAECSLMFWDALRIGADNLAQAPLEERKARLEALVAGRADNVGVTATYEASLENCLAAKTEATRHRVESKCKTGFIHGVVLKRKGSPRRDSVTRSVEHVDWMKIVFFT